MAKRGPKPRPAPVPAPSGGPLWADFEPPKLTDDARAEFDRLKAALQGIGTLERTDPSLVVLAARLSSLIAQAMAQVEKEGLTVDGVGGNSVKHPLLEVLNGQTMRLRGLMNDFGLTPESSKLGGAAKPQKSDDKWSGILTVAG